MAKIKGKPRKCNFLHLPPRAISLITEWTRGAVERPRATAAVVDGREAVDGRTGVGRLEASVLAQGGAYLFAPANILVALTRSDML